MSLWTDFDAPRIWRCPESDFGGDEPRHAHRVYTAEALSDIHSHNFNGIWLRGRLYDLMQSTTLPQLNAPHRNERVQSLRTVIERGQEQCVHTYLFFNEPLGLSVDHPLWQTHPHLKGALCDDPDVGEPVYTICTSTSEAMNFIREAVDSVLDALPGLAGVILITASELPSHCWSRTFRYALSDGILDDESIVPDCPRCRQREPSELVLDLLRIWRDAAADRAPGCRVLAWNWSWSTWYRDPQAPIVSQLPENIELLVDWERGGILARKHHNVVIDEYSLSYPGPSERFLTTQATAPDGAPVHAKLQLGTTHEIATVPNLPLMHSLHAKFTGMTRHGVAGTMACWNFGCSLTLNSYAAKLYAQNPHRYLQADAFLDDLAEQYLGVTHPAAIRHIRQAWQAFDSAFRENFPFSILFVYRSPINDAPAHPLSLQYRAERLGASHLPHDFGDDAGSCLGTLDIHDVTRQLDQLVAKWHEGLPHYEQALTDAPSTDASTNTHRRLELSCARMIGVQMKSALNFFRFHQRRLEITDGVNSPCELPPDEQLLAVMRDEIDTATAALPFVETDPRLGLHQESHAVMYNSSMICTKIETMRQELGRVTR